MIVSVIEHSGDSVGCEPSIEASVAINTQLTDAETKKTAQEQYLAVAFLLGADRSKFGRLLENLENDFLQGQNNYPKTITGAYNLLTNWKHGTHMHNLPSNDGVTFTYTHDDEENDVTLVNSGNQEQTSLGKYPHITCTNCNKKGHYATTCRVAIFCYN